MNINDLLEMKRIGVCYEVQERFLKSIFSFLGNCINSERAQTSSETAGRSVDCCKCLVLRMPQLHIFPSVALNSTDICFSSLIL